MPQSHAMQTLLEENNELFIPLNNTNTMGMYYTPEKRFKLFDCHARPPWNTCIARTADIE